MSGICEAVVAAVVIPAKAIVIPAKAGIQGAVEGTA